MKKADFNSYITAHLVYPEAARKQFIEGIVYVSYVIDADGKVKDVVVQSSNSILDKAAVDVVAQAPKWKSATYKGARVAYKKIFSV